MELITNLLKEQSISADLTVLKNIVGDFLNDKDNSLTSLFNIIKNNEAFINYILDIVNNNNTEGQTDFLLQKIITILNIEGFDDVTNFLFEPEYIISILNLTEGIFIRNSSFQNIYYIIKPLIMKYPVTLFRLLYNAIKVLNNRNRLIDTIAEFFYKNKNNQLISGISNFVVELITDFIKEESISADLTVLDNIVEDFLNDKDSSLTSLFNMIKNDETFIELITDILNNNKTENQTDFLLIKYRRI